MKRCIALISVLMMSSVAAFVPPSFAAEPWPSRPITLVVTFAPGGPADGVARIVADELSEKLGQRVIVENKGGAGGNIGAAAVAKSRPDGYTLLFVSPGPGAVNKVIYKSLTYDPLKDFAPIVLTDNTPQIIVASPKLPVQDLNELVRFGRKTPLNAGNAGYGTTGHISAVLFARETGVQLSHVAYRGIGPMLIDVMSGQIEVGFGGYVPQIQNMKALAVTGVRRTEVLPYVPTVRETGQADVVAGVWHGILAPAGTPRLIIDKVNAIVNEFFKSPQGRKIADSLGMEVLGGSPEDMGAFMIEELSKWEPIIRAANIVVD